MVNNSVIMSDSVLQDICIPVNPKSITELPCSPISQILNTRLPVTHGNRNGGLQRELPTTDQIIHETAQSWWIPN
jgi:hypothetical protein